ncbi:hypothetical protein J6590_041390 [Homalodisca vitripennis]|nr:hypothetical protein J6590_041390 [Homalodisca vitripennis]
MDPKQETCIIDALLGYRPALTTSEDTAPQEEQRFSPNPLNQARKAPGLLISQRKHKHITGHGAPEASCTSTRKSEGTGPADPTGPTQPTASGRDRTLPNRYVPVDISHSDWCTGSTNRDAGRLGFPPIPPLPSLRRGLFAHSCLEGVERI